MREEERARVLAADFQNVPPSPRDFISQSARAFVRVRELLLKGEFRRGDRITEVPLAMKLAMSRTPIRTALERLAHVGLLNVGVSGGFTVPEFTIAEVLDAIELRALLEGTAARLAAERLVNDHELEGARRYARQMEVIGQLTTESLPEYMDLNEAFHYAIVELAKSTSLRRSVDQIYALPFSAPSAMVYPTSLLSESDQMLGVSLEHHRAILEAIARRQFVRAEYLGREHAYVGRRALELVLSDTTALNKIPGAPLINMSAQPTQSRRTLR